MGRPEDALGLLESICERDDGSRLARHAHFVLRSLAPSLANPTSVQDVVSSVFLTACQIIRSEPRKLPETREGMLAWLRRIVIFKCLELAKKKRTSREIQLTPEIESVYVEHSTVDILDLDDYEPILARAYEVLTEDEQQVLRFYLQHNMTSRMIADRLKKEPAAVRKTKTTGN